MASLPVPDRSFEKLAFLTPGVQRERWEYMDMRGSPVVGSSSSAPSTAYFVDGASFTDPYFGRSRVELSQDAIREMRVVNNRFDAEIGGSAGGSISLVTKTGGNSVQRIGLRLLSFGRAARPGRPRDRGCPTTRGPTSDSPSAVPSSATAPTTSSPSSTSTRTTSCSSGRVVPSPGSPRMSCVRCSGPTCSPASTTASRIRRRLTGQGLVGARPAGQLPGRRGGRRIPRLLARQRQLESASGPHLGDQRGHAQRTPGPGRRRATSGCP